MRLILPKVGRIRSVVPVQGDVQEIDEWYWFIALLTKQGVERNDRGVLAFPGYQQICFHLALSEQIYLKIR